MTSSPSAAGSPAATARSTAPRLLTTTRRPSPLSSAMGEPEGGSLGEDIAGEPEGGSLGEDVPGGSRRDSPWDLSDFPVPLIDLSRTFEGFLDLEWLELTA